MNTAMQFYGIKLKQSQTMQLVLGMEVKDIPAIKRTKEQAEALIETTEVVLVRKKQVNDMLLIQLMLSLTNMTLIQ